MEGKFYITIKEKIFNKKSHTILNYFDKYNYKKKILNSIESINFLNDNKDKKYKVIFYEHTGTAINYFNPIIKYLRTLENINIDIYFFIFDWWHYGTSEYIYYPKNYKIIFNITSSTFIKDNYGMDNINNFLDNISFFNFWCCYNSSFVEFNNNPIDKLIISGDTNKGYYPERNKLKEMAYIKCFSESIYHYSYNHSDKEILSNNYNYTLNKYFASFASSVHILNIKEKRVNSKIFLLKFFEILASGSLLVCPKSMENELNKIGLINNKNCYLIDIEQNQKDIYKEIEYIFNNKEFYNEIRYNGYILAKKTFSEENIFKEFKILLNDN